MKRAGVMTRLLRALRHNDEGVALVLVIGVGSVVALLLVAAVAVTLNGVRSARLDESYSGALAAAYAGVEEYQSRLAADPDYTRFGNPASRYSSGAEAPAASATLSLPTGENTNPAFGLGAAGSWATVAGSDGAASFRYEVNTAELASAGTVSLRATGRVGTETRTVVAELRVNSFLDYLYFTDYEIEDPSRNGSTAAEITRCVKYAHAGRPTGCHEIAFVRGDVLDGPVHSNDTFRSCGATFRQEVTTANPTTPLYLSTNSSGSANCRVTRFDDAGSPRATGMVVMPATNTELRLATRSDLADPAGCLFTGPTQITLNAEGTVTVRSPWTKATQVQGDPVRSGTAPARCGIPGSGAGGLGSATGSTFPVPTNNVIYVQDVPAVPGDPNFWPSGNYPMQVDATGTSRALRCEGVGGQASGNGIGYPAQGEVNGDPTAYGCRAGDAFVRGTLRGALTIGTANQLYVTGDIRYADRTRDVLGLVGDGSVLVWNPVDAAKQSVLPDGDRQGRTIEAAILSVAHTFEVQNHSAGGNRGTLSVRGAIAQKFRGIVRYTSPGAVHGYSKQYVYDTRFEYLTPPKFLLPVSTTFDVTSWIETGTAFSAAGAAQ